MRVMVLGIATEGSEQGEPPTAEAFAAMDRFTEELVEAGVLVAAAGLKPTAQGKRIVFDGPDVTVIDGPFTKTKELVAGFSIWEVKNMDEAVAWAKRSPNPVSGLSKIEIRPFFEAADLTEFLTPEELATPPRGGARKARSRLTRSGAPSRHRAAPLKAWVPEGAFCSAEIRSPRRESIGRRRAPTEPGA